MNAGLGFIRFVMSRSFPAAPAALSLGAEFSLSCLSECGSTSNIPKRHQGIMPSSLVPSPADLLKMVW